MYTWELFFNDKITKIFTEKKEVIDIGGGLRIGKGNRYDKKREWIKPLAEKIDYKMLDPIPDYNPDIVGDIHDLPFKDNSVDAIICLAVLQHIENPHKACAELYRVLKPGGYCFVYVPFLYYYHAAKPYYNDYWRYTTDSIDLLFKDFTQIEKSPIRYPLATWMRLSPFGRKEFVVRVADFFDRVFKKTKSNQVSGYDVFLVK